MTTIPDELLTQLRSAKSIVVLTGAGVSAESGIPTFRDALTGYWSRMNPEDLATPEAFRRDPAMVSRWYDERRCGVADCQPNAGHIALAALQRIVVSRGGRFMLTTQNIDGLHQRAGSTDVIELHGTLWTWRCEDCAEESPEYGPPFDTHPSLCACGGNKRPGVVWFGESLPQHALKSAQEAAFSCDVMLSLGTSGLVYPAAGLIDIALTNGSYVAEINPNQTPFSSQVHWWIAGTTGAVLPEIVAAMG